MAEAPTSNLRSLSHSTSPASNPQKGEPCTGIVQLAEGEKRPRNMSHWHSVIFWQLEPPHSIFKRTAKAREREAVLS